MTPPFSLIRIGTRKSALALAQADIVRGQLLAAFAGMAVELAPFVTSGDSQTDRPLADIGGKGLFTKELEEALLRGDIDIAVHSLKDMETRLPDGLAIASVLEREDPRDALISREGHTLASLPSGSRIGTSSPRRAAQLRMVRPDLLIVPLRGNVPTRIAKLKQGDADAILLALAGLKRLGLQGEASQILDSEHFLPAAGQGTLAIECRQNHAALRPMLESIRHLPTHYATLAERGVLAAIDGSCRTPIGAFAQVDGEDLRLAAMLSSDDGSVHAQTTRQGSVHEAEMLGRDAGEELLRALAASSRKP